MSRLIALVVDSTLEDKFPVISLHSHGILFDTEFNPRVNDSDSLMGSVLCVSDTSVAALDDTHHAVHASNVFSIIILKI